MGQFSLIRSWNCATFVLLDSLLCKECSEKFCELFSTNSISWETGSAGLLGYVFKNNG